MYHSLLRGRRRVYLRARSHCAKAPSENKAVQGFPICTDFFPQWDLSAQESDLRDLARTCSPSFCAILLEHSTAAGGKRERERKCVGKRKVEWKRKKLATKLRDISCLLSPPPPPMTYFSNLLEFNIFGCSKYERRGRPNSLSFR